MSEPVTVQAGWAVWSKQPGTRDDYSVLASSAGPLSAAEFSSVLAHFAPGNPPADNGVAASLPWVMLSRVGVDEQTYLGVSVQVPTESVDATGGPISRTSYICVPYEDVARKPVAYDGLSGALARAHLPHPGGGLVPLAVPGLDPAELARAVIEFGPNTVATTAALLLSGPVTITGPDFPDTATRLRFLNAVAALLPYGYRASYTAATWSDTGAGPRFRMVFANRAREEASRVTWGMPASVPADGPARDYLGYLQRVVSQTAEIMSLTSLIAYLSRDTQPRKFEQPEQAVASLGEFFRAAVVGDAIDSGSVTAADVRLLFSRGQDGQLAPGRRGKALRYLITAGDAQDWQLISQRFGEIDDGRPQDLLPAVTQTCRRLLWSAAPKGLVGDYLRLVAPYGLANDLLARLMAPPDSTADLAEGLETAARLLADFAMDSPASYPGTRQALGDNAAAGAALLARLCAPRGAAGVGIAVDWLEPVLDRILPPFNAVLADAVDGGTGIVPEPVSANAIEGLSRDGGQLSVRYLLQAASFLGRLHLVLPGLAPWLARAAIQRGMLDRRFWNDVAMELAPRNAMEAGWLDIVLLATGNDPRSLLAEKIAQPQFNRALGAAWQELTDLLEKAFNAGQAADDLLTGALIGFLGRRTWRTSEGQAAVVEDFTGWLTANGARPQLKAAVLDPTEALRQLPPQATATQIAQACARAYAGRLVAEQAGEALAKSGAITSGTQAADVLEQLHRALSADRTEVSDAWQESLAMVFAGGTFGEQTAAEFAALIVQNARWELFYHLNLLRIAASSPVEGAPPALTDADTDYFDDARGILQDIVRDARKRPGGRIARGLMGITGRKGNGEGGGGE